MEIEVVNRKKITNADLGWASLSCNEKSQSLSIDAKEFGIRITPKGFHLTYTIHRPTHDHNNSPDIFFEMPESGRIVEYNESATLTVQSSSGYTALDMRFNDYVWERGLHLIVQEWEYKRMRELVQKKGVKALLDRIGYEGHFHMFK